LGEALVGIDPGGNEDGIAPCHRPADEGIFGSQVEDVELVDPGRKNQKRPFINLIRCWIILQELYEFIAEYDFSGCRRDILADGEGVSRLANGKLAFAPVDILEQIVKTLNQVLAIALQSSTQDLGIG